ncbi:hypothetical protein AN639_01705 [Candidatus Epulonipiscium fishelsonii]|uniref:Uncharacterized protein n=1 Tax=Candidatus Epulonipiscium fishelsonii TaxID=77094 RepID=A0ACC8XE81_9FIRM|nr:hypothetical protein AN639_01705 [Epulopiscium sp. SCG-B05WGA-EpuloA1]ONI41219.1 hypothetical protein AN396_03785 [Epulopiscium sp. SCG-B11WGA-EpuloA1]
MLLIKNATIHNGKKQIFKNTDILVKNGIISSIGKNIHIQAEVIDATNKVVIPGFIDPLNVYGTRGLFRENDGSENTDPILPQMDIIYSMDQDGMNFQELYTYGITSSGITPGPQNVMGGQMGVFKTYGRNPYKMLIKEKVGMAVNLTNAPKNLYGKRSVMPMTRMGVFALFESAIKKAMEYDSEKDYDAKCEALMPVINGEMPIFVSCYTKMEMKSTEHMLKQFPKIKVVYVGAYGIDRDFEPVKTKKSPLILGDLTSAMSSINQHINFEDIEDMMNDGAVIACGNAGEYYASGKENLLWNALLWHKGGVSAENVLSAITYNPAKILGVDDRVGTIEIGKDADIAIWSNNPITTYNAQLVAIYQNGENLLTKEKYRSCW